MDHVTVSTVRTAFLSNRLRPLALVTAALLALASTGAIAGGGHAGIAHQPAQHGALDDMHLQHLIHHVMSQVDAPQKEKIQQIAQVAHADLQALEQRAQAARAPRARILLADVVDRGALERVRSAEMRIADERSRRVDQLLVDVAAVLTPQQRAQWQAGAAH